MLNKKLSAISIIASVAIFCTSALLVFSCFTIPAEREKNPSSRCIGGGQIKQSRLDNRHYKNINAVDDFLVFACIK